MKKKIIFVTEALWLGGIEISLVNVLKNIDYDRFDVTVLALRNYRDLESQIPAQCRLIIADRMTGSYPFKRLFGLMEKPRNPSQFRRFIWKVLCLLLKAPEAALWAKHIRTLFPGEHFDTAVIYDNRTAETIVRGISTDRYLMFYHQGIMSHAYHDHYGWKKAEKVIAVSDPIAEKLRSFMPKYAGKVMTIGNLIDLAAIREKSQAETDVIFDDTKISLVSCGRLSREKGMHIALEACGILKQRGFDNFAWYIIGGGREMDNLQKQRRALGIEDRVFLLGQKSNPFPYLRQADLFVQTSLFESYGLSLAEAMVLGLPVVSTRTDGAIALTENGKLGLLCDIAPASVADAIASLLASPEKLSAWKDTVSTVDMDIQNRRNMNKLEGLLLNEA